MSINNEYFTSIQNCVYVSIECFDDGGKEELDIDQIRFHQNDVIIRSHILILHVDRNVKQYSSTTVT